jgi:hypothetical protein
MLVDNGRFILNGYIGGSKGFGASLEEFINLMIFFGRYHHLKFERDLFGSFDGVYLICRGCRIVTDLRGVMHN